MICCSILGVWVYICKKEQQNYWLYQHSLEQAIFFIASCVDFIFLNSIKARVNKVQQLAKQNG